MKFVLDASVLVPIFAADAFSARADAWIDGRDEGLVVSDLASAEFSSAVGRKHRAEGLSREDALVAFGAFDVWVEIATERVPVTSRDILRAEEAVRLLDPPLRAPDAIHPAITRRLGATLVTSDRQLATAADALGVPLIVP